MKKIVIIVFLISAVFAACSLLPQPWKINSLEFDPGEITLMAGERKTIELRAEPPRVLDHVTLDYSVTDSSVAEVIPSNNNFLIAAYKAGQVLVTAEGSDGSTFHYPVTVLPENEGALFRLSQQYLNLKKGGQKSLLVTGNQGSQLTWSYAPPDQNVVRLLGTGESVLVIAENRGEVVLMASNDLGQSAACEIMVTEDEALKFTPSVMELEWNDTSATTHLDFTPRDLELTFHMEDERIAGYEYNPLTQVMTIIPLAGGKTMLTVTGGGVSAFLSIIVNIDYKLNITSDILTLEPCESGTFFYSAIPADAEIEWSLSEPSMGSLIVNPNASVTVTPSKEGEFQVIGSLLDWNLKDYIKIISWYSELKVGITDNVTRPCDEDDDNEQAGFHNRNFWVVDNVQNQLKMNFSQAGVKINSITWTKSADFDEFIEYQIFENGKRLVFEFHPPFTLFNEKDPGGSLTVQVNYSNNKVWSKTIPIMLYRRNG